jgi:phosphate starvation-inducible PhoH-like protein
MATKRASKKRCESVDITEDFKNSFKKNFICSNLTIKKQLPLTGSQVSFCELVKNDKTNMVFLDGPAGSAKSYCAVYSALELLRDQKVEKIIYIRTVIESASRSLGYLKGDETEKFAAYTMVLNEKCLESIDKNSLISLTEQEYIKAIPVNFARGLTFNNSMVIFDEAQNATRSELTTILTRFGRHTKYIICGDSRQRDIRDSGFEEVFTLFDTEFSRKNNIYCLAFDTTDIVRSPILKHITQVLNV